MKFCLQYHLSLFWCLRPAGILIMCLAWLGLFSHWLPVAWGTPGPQARSQGPQKVISRSFAKSTPPRQCKKKTRTQGAKKNPPTDNLAAAVAREMMRDPCGAGGAASRLAEPLPPPRGAGGASPGVIVGTRGQARKQEPEDHFPHCHPCPQSRGCGSDNGLVDNREEQMVFPLPLPHQLVPASLPGLLVRSG